MVVEKGYKQTEIGVIPEDWQTRTIGSFTDLCAGGTPSTYVREYWNGDIRWMNSGELNYKRVFEVENRITELGLINSATKLIPINSILIGLAGQGKTRGTVAINKVELCTNQSIAAIFPCKEVDYNYLFFNLDSRYNELRGLSTGDGGRGGLNLTIIKNLYVPIPPTKIEQTAIANALSDMDALIAQTEKLIEKKKAIKQGVMQELLNPREGWVTKKLGEVCEIKKGQLITDSSRVNGDIPVIAGGKTPAYYHNKMNRLGKTITISGSGASAGYVSFHEYPIFASDCSTISSSNKYNIEFIFYWLQLNQSMIYSLQTGGAQPHIHPSDLNPLDISLPPIDDQDRIAIIFRELQSDINLLETKLQKLKNQKQGMMQALLTGKIRLI